MTNSMAVTKEQRGDVLSLTLRVETLDAHQAAEEVQFIQDLIAGRLPLDDYTSLVAQHHAIYRALEAAVAATTDTDLAAFCEPALERVPALERDLEFLAGDDWASRYHSLDATEAYVAHLRDVCTASPVALLAHHYTRYLGDLSGGQVIGRVLRRTYGFSDHRGTEFYYFPDLTSPKAFKDRYREQLDELMWTAAQRDELIREVNAAYELNTAVFEALTEVSTPRPE